MTSRNWYTESNKSLNHGNNSKLSTKARSPKAESKKVRNAMGTVKIIHFVPFSYYLIFNFCLADAIEARSPLREEFIDAFQKCKYSFIILVSLHVVANFIYTE